MNDTLEDTSIEQFKQYCTFDIETGYSSGFKAGEMAVMMASRGTGKSQIAHYAALFNSIFTTDPLTDIKLSEGKVYGYHYHTLEPVGGSWRDMEEWCIKSFGPPGGNLWEGSRNSHATTPNERWYQNNRKFWFRDVKDRDWFLMRWRS